MVQSIGNGIVTMVKRDVHSGCLFGLDIAECHCIHNRPFNRSLYGGLEYAGLTVDFGSRRISHDGVTFSYRREVRQYVIEEDSTSKVDAHMACPAQCGPFDLELFASHDNKHLEVHYTIEDSAFVRDWSGHACYGNPLFEHDFILRGLTGLFSVVKEYPAGVQRVRLCYKGGQGALVGVVTEYVSGPHGSHLVQFDDDGSCTRGPLRLEQVVYDGERAFIRVGASSYRGSVSSAATTTAAAAASARAAAATTATRAARPVTTTAEGAA
ncbi:hypothetical protein CYMTET_40259 [Cymbomonas tetramitiformis]|uniref:Uncharacterized protein n=1 Tax=Cymbomonas tetramitiformis TaxID=36881 RepID=A0AAE0CAJ0_9CHLO|nr:hypothetical protein CYMTET_40259 [Cymbomonas tetramitiformis]